MARLLDSPEGFEKVHRAILIVARKKINYFKGMEFEDLVQELWLYMVEKQPEEIEWAMAQLKNYCKDLKRKDDRKMGGIEVMDMGDPISEKKIHSDAPSFNYSVSSDTKPFQKIDPSRRQSSSFDPFEKTYDSMSMSKFLEKLGDRERKFVVAKGYLSANINEYYDEYTKMYNELSEDKKELLRDAKRSDSDDIIMKVFLNIKTGTNSGTVRSIKTNIRKASKEFFGKECFA